MARKRRLVVVLAVTSWLVVQVVMAGLLGNGSSLAGPVDIVIKDIQPCPKRLRGENGFRLTNSSGFRLENRPFEYFWTADFSMSFPIADSGIAELRLAQWIGGSWKVGFKIIRISQICSALSIYEGKLWESIMFATFGKRVDCPVPVVKHAAIRNLSLNTKTINLKEFLYGRWRCDTIVLAGATKKGCVRIYTDISPAVGSQAHK